MAFAHGTLSRICVDYLRFQDVASIDRSQRDPDDPRPQTNECYLLDYAATNWVNHYNSQPAELAKHSRRAAMSLCSTSSPEVNWYSFCPHSLLNYSKWTELEIASYFGLTYVVEGFLNDGADVNAGSGAYGSALQAASRNGYHRIVKTLLDKGADVNIQGGAYGDALQAASRYGYNRIVQILLDNGATDTNGNALSEASERVYA